MSDDRRMISLRVPADVLAEIDRYATAAGMSRTEYLLSSALARGRGGHDVEDAWRVIEAALRRCGAL